MNRVLLVLLGFWFIQCQSLVEKANSHIVIEPVTSREYGLYVVKQALEPLNLTCTILENSRYDISWILPRNTTNSNHVITRQYNNSASLIISHLESTDYGAYSCEALPLDPDLAPLRETVVVNIKNRCAEKMFTCNLSKHGICIARRFACDGHQDCEKGEDEDKDMCGHDPCVNKLPCQDRTEVVRCIPKAWCCDIRIDTNCSVKEPLSCCPNSFQKFMDERSYYETLKPHYYDMAFAIYTVIGCAVVFMVVVTVLVIAICRVYKWPNTLPPRSTHLNENAGTMYEVDMYCSGPPGLLVTYNIGPDIQTVGRAVLPPPYSQVVAIPPKQGPPPPYTPLDIPEAEALLNQALNQGADSNQENGASIRSDLTPNRQT